jgi:dipeptidyl aminopeptidase/acylaminoacyl peptidase
MIPLVVQASDYSSTNFLPDGSATTAYAAQALVSHGMAVLQMRFSDIEGVGTPREGPSFVDGADSAVAHLAAQRLIDEKKVGLVGFSRNGYLVQFAIANRQRTKFSAAIAADAWDGGYWGYVRMFGGTLEQDRPLVEAQYGGGLWEKPESWLANAPPFRAPHVTTPLLLTPIGKGALLGIWEAYGALRINGKPVDLMYFPMGEHQLVRPRERVDSMQATVDWMAFWLTDRPPADAARALRWAKLKERQKEQRND